MPTRKTVSACYHSEISVNQAFIISYTFTSLLEITGKEEALLLLLTNFTSLALEGMHRRR